MGTSEKIEFRNFTSFKKRGEVLREFNLKFEEKGFVKEKTYTNNDFKKRILKKFKKRGVFNSEYSICEAIIYPILAEVSEDNDLPIWSHFKLESPEVKMTGEADYLFGFSELGDDDYDNPIICVGEAKKENFTIGWAQISAEMIAAQKINNNDDIPIYGIVTTGKQWEFAVLEGDKYIYDELNYSTPKDLDTVLNILNWMFSEGKKNAEILKASLKR